MIDWLSENKLSWESAYSETNDHTFVNILAEVYGIVTNKKVTHLCTNLRCNFGLLLCWKAFSENTTHQQHSPTASRSHQDNYLYLIGLQPLKHSLMPLRWTFIALRCFYYILFTSAWISLCILSDDGLTSSVFQGLPANHVQVVVLVTSGHCCSSVADEEWYFPKRPSNTVATQHCSEAQYRGESPIHFRLYVSFPLNGVSSTLPPLRPSGTGLHVASVVPFVGPYSSLSPLRWTFTALRCRDLTGSSLAKSFTVFMVCWFVSPYMIVVVIFLRCSTIFRNKTNQNFGKREDKMKAIWKHLSLQHFGVHFLPWLTHRT